MTALKYTPQEKSQTEKPAHNKEKQHNSRWKIRWHEDSRLWACKDNKEIPVNISRCFPWSDPKRYISLRDNDGEEVALLTDLSTLDKASRDALETALKSSGFVLEIIGVISIEEDFEIRSWHVRTRQGDRRFQTKLDEWPYEVPGGGLLIKDVAGDLYYVDNPDHMDERSRRLFWAFAG
jgi:hypothetical protein